MPKSDSGHEKQKDASPPTKRLLAKLDLAKI
jgi:hypothetical protein